MRGQEPFFVGIDWGNVTHCVAVLDQRIGKYVWQAEVKNKAESLAGLMDELERVTGAATGLPVGIERPDGPVVAWLQSKGHEVFSVNPRQMKHYRQMRNVSGAKDDRRDARLLAEALHKNPEAFRRVRPASRESNQLKALVRSHTAMTEDLVRQSLRLRDCLSEYYPQFLELTDDFSKKWVRAVFAAAPTPKKARSMGLAKLKTILTKNSGRVSRAQELLTKLHGRSLVVPDGQESDRAYLASYLLNQLASSREALREVERKMDDVLSIMRIEPARSEATVEKPSEHDQDGLSPSNASAEITPAESVPTASETKYPPSDAEILASMPGAGRKTQATLLGFAPHSIDLREEYALRALSGVAPITVASGKTTRVSMRRSAHQALRYAMHHWAAKASVLDKRFHEIFVRSRQRGHSVAASYRRVGDALLKTLFAMLRNKTIYDPNRHFQRSEAGSEPTANIA